MLSAKLKEAAGNSADATLYVDDVFSTYLYTGTGSTQTITNGIDLAGKGGMVWTKCRSNAQQNWLFDTVRGSNSPLGSNITGSASDNYATYFSPATGIVSASSTGYSLAATTGGTNTNNFTYASWTFRKAPKFFDVVTYTGTGSARTIAHSLGIAPGMIIVKNVTTGYPWQVYSNGLTSAAYSMQLNSSNAQASAPNMWDSTAPTSSVFSVGTDASVNNVGDTYVAYLYAHDTSSTGIIQCGSLTSGSNYSAIAVTIGWEPQYILIKPSSGAGGWWVVDNMRGLNSNETDQFLSANSSAAESSLTRFNVMTTGFTFVPGDINTTYIYMAIRRPNKPPTSGTQVFEPVIRAGTDSASGNTIPTSFAVDLLVNKNRNDAQNFPWVDRLRGVHQKVTSNNTSAEATMTTQGPQSFNNTGIPIGPFGGEWNVSAGSYMEYLFKRAPKFFDEVCYTGNGATQNINHNLTSSPELLIFADRTSSGANFTTWQVACSQLGLSAKGAWLCFTNAFSTSYENIITAATSTTFSLDSSYGSYTPNVSTHTYVAYLFATLAGISKVGSYTGNGTSQNIECGFAAGARFFLVKATSTTGSWWVWDSARGITAGNDPALQLNSTAAEITTADAVDPYTAGITVNQEATCSINASGVSYVYLAIS